MLKLINITVKHKGIEAVKGVTIHVGKNEIITLIGSNGAGKTSLLEAISGLNKNMTGEIVFDGEHISKQAPYQIVRLGISLVPEGRQIFGSMSVYDNLLLGGYTLIKKGKTRNTDMDIIFDIFPVLKKRINQTAGTLSGGEQQMLAIGRALMAKPRVLLLDEPSTGLAPLVVKDIFKILSRLKSEMGLSILLVEQNARLALQYSARGYVMETGYIISEGVSEDLLNDNNIIRAYLGKNYKDITDR